ncbi:hypothetical protein Mapa_000636 [Marchantia paleacea]|nr:hypothetical protein Mapa_000636 [Marchantia paleacea]
MDVGEVMNRTRAESAVDTIESHFAKAIANLQFVERALASELDATYPKHINPYNIVNRIKQLEAELPVLSKECQQLFAAKQDLIDTAKKNLVQNRALVRRMQARAGLSVPSDSEDAVYTSFKEILKEWNRSVQSRDPSATNGHMMAKHDLNATVFQSKARAVDS